MDTSTRFDSRLLPYVFACALLTGIAFALVGQMQAAEPIDILNPGFELTGDDGVADWQFVADPAHAESADGVATVAQLTQDQENAREGSASAKIHHEGPRWATLRQQVALERGATYRLRVFARSEDLGEKKVRIVARLFSRENREHVITQPEGIVYLDTGGDWQEISHDFEIPDTMSSANKVWLELKAILTDPKSAPADIWFDDVSLERIDPT